MHSEGLDACSSCNASSLLAMFLRHVFFLDRLVVTGSWDVTWAIDGLAT